MSNQRMDEDAKAIAEQNEQLLKNIEDALDEAERLVNSLEAEQRGV